MDPQQPLEASRQATTPLGSVRKSPSVCPAPQSPAPSAGPDAARFESNFGLPFTSPGWSEVGIHHVGVRSLCPGLCWRRAWKGRGSAAWGCGHRHCFCFLVCVSGKRLNVPGRPLLACVACVTPKHGVAECRARGIPKYSCREGEERRQWEQGRWGEESWFSGCVRKGAAGLRPGALAGIRGPSLCQAGCPGRSGSWEAPPPAVPSDSGQHRALPVPGAIPPSSLAPSGPHLSPRSSQIRKDLASFLQCVFLSPGGASTLSTHGKTLGFSPSPRMDGNTVKANPCYFIPACGRGPGSLSAGALLEITRKMRGRGKGILLSGPTGPSHFL